jgi:hypothetical protein
VYSPAAAAALIALSAATLCAQSELKPPTLTIKFPAEIEPGSCDANWMVQGINPRPGGRSAGVPSADRTFTIVPKEGVRAAAIRVVIDCRGFGVSLVDAALSPGATVTIAPTRLGTVHLRGLVEFPGATQGKRFVVGMRRGDSSEIWRTCIFLLNPGVGSAISCLTYLRLPTETMIPPVTIGPAGDFEMDVPDFARDPSVPKPYEETLVFHAWPGAQTGAAFLLRPVPDDTRSGELRPRLAYPDVIQLRAEPVNRF